MRRTREGGFIVRLRRKVRMRTLPFGAATFGLTSVFGRRSSPPPTLGVQCFSTKVKYYSQGSSLYLPAGLLWIRRPPTS